MTFENLVFNPHPIGHGAVQATVKFPNNYGVSVVGGPDGLYGDGVNTFEVAVLHGSSLCYKTPITSDVEGWLTKDEVSQLLQAVEALPENPNCTHGRPE